MRAGHGGHARRNPPSVAIAPSGSPSIALKGVGTPQRQYAPVLSRRSLGSDWRPLRR
jgi:hypothetical protein